MLVLATDIPLLRQNWVAARDRRRQANSDIEATGLGRDMMALRQHASEKSIASGIMSMMAKLRLQIRHTYAIMGPARKLLLYCYSNNTKHTVRFERTVESFTFESADAAMRHAETMVTKETPISVFNVAWKTVLRTTVMPVRLSN
jgi:hypothetical protein